MSEPYRIAYNGRRFRIERVVPPRMWSRRARWEWFGTLTYTTYEEANKVFQVLRNEHAWTRPWVEVVYPPAPLQSPPPPPLPEFLFDRSEASTSVFGTMMIGLGIVAAVVVASICLAYLLDMRI